MKTALAAVGSLLAGVLMLPLLLAGGDAPPPIICGTVSGPVAVVLETIRTLESGGNYQAKAAGSTASGAYQFLDSTWNNYGGYQRAADAPAAVQDAKAAEHVTGILDAHDQDVTTVPVTWYIGHVPDRRLPRVGHRALPLSRQRPHTTAVPGALDDHLRPAPPPDTRPGTDDELDLAGSRCLHRRTGPGGRRRLGAPRPDRHDRRPPRRPRQPPLRRSRLGLDHPRRHTHLRRPRRHRQQHPHLEQELVGRRLRREPAAATATPAASASPSKTPTASAGPTATAARSPPPSANRSPPANKSSGAGNTGRSGAPHVHLEIRVNGEQRCPQVLLVALYREGIPTSPNLLPTTGCIA